MCDNLYPAASRELSQARQALASEANDAFVAFSRSVFKAGALDAKTKQLIAVAAAHVTQCPYCIRGHTKQALRAGATREEVLEAIWVAAEMRAGAAVAHTNLALDAMNEVGS
jgi:AhpD family alkylhydroperoxidase